MIESEVRVLSGEQSGIVSDGPRTNHIGVDTYADKRMVGRFWCDETAQTPFASAIEMLELMRETVERAGFPDAYDRIKTFAEPRKTPDREGRLQDTDFREGELATFAVKVLFRQNSSWQGIIIWLEGQREESFRSVYEMLMLMDSALEASRNHEQG